jgi:hypothetical protein
MSKYSAEEAAEILGKFTVIIGAMFIGAPLLLICGIRFIQEASGYGLTPYSWSSFGGALIVLFALKLKINLKD